MMYEEWLRKKKRPRHQKMIDDKEVVQAMHEGGVELSTMAVIYGVSEKYARWVLTQ